MKFLVFTGPIEGIEKKLPRPEEFEAQIGWIREQLDSGPHRLRLSRRESRSGDRQCRVTRGLGAALRHDAAG